jgi:DNA-binding MarR family transcriptional regulator
MAKNSGDDSQGRLTGTQSIERALLLLREIAAHNRAGSRLLDLATRTNLQRPTVHRMLKCLATRAWCSRIRKPTVISSARWPSNWA